MNHYPRIEGIIESLKNSTRREISLAGETVHFEGLNSPYVSHQRVDVDCGHGFPQLVIFENNCAWLAVTPPVGYTTVSGHVVSVSLPSFHLLPLFCFPTAPPDWFKGLLMVHLVDRFTGFDDDGRLLLRPSATVRATWSGCSQDIFAHTWGERLGTVGCTEVWRLKDGRFLFGRYGVYAVGDKLSEDAAHAYMDAHEQDSNALDKILDDAGGYSLQCPHECGHCDACTNCEHRYSVSLEGKA